MYVRNLLKSGQFVTLVPVGLPVTLQYGNGGKIEQVYLGHEDDRVNVTDQVLAGLTLERLVPLKINIQMGVTFVDGVLYSGKLFPVNGKLPECAYDAGLEHFKQHPEEYKFHAGNAHSTGTQFVGATATRQWLSSAKFSVLPGFLVPPNMNSALFKSLAASARFYFKAGIVQSYIVFDAKKIAYYNTGMRQVYAGTVTQFLNEAGATMSTITLKGIPEKLVVSYRDTVQWNIHPNSLIVLDSKDRIICSELTDDKKRPARSYDMVCKVCNRPYKVDLHSLAVCCPDEHCMSRMYPRVKHLTATLNLPCPTFEAYMDAVNNKQILVLADLFLLDLYKDMKIDVSISTLLRAIIPLDAIPSADVLSLLSNGCGNKVANVIYYAQHPENIAKDLRLAHMALPRLVEWLQDSQNIFDLEGIFDAHIINVTGVDRMFNGSPILRNKTIMITGKFTHGPSGDIYRILQSYDAKVVRDLTGHIDCVVVGDIPEDVNSAAVRSAKANQVPVLSESQFFEQFQIDEDILQHLT